MASSNLFLYMSTILIWGSTWYAIKLQFGVVDPTLSVGYRFALAGLILTLVCFAKRLSFRFSPRDWVTIVLQGLSLYSVNYILFYIASVHLTSGIVAVVFSSLSLMNSFNSAVFFRAPIQPRIACGASLGFAGLFLIFFDEIAHGIDNWQSLLIAVLATYVASWGNIIAGYNARRGLPALQLNAIGMSLSAVVSFAYCLTVGVPIVFDSSWQYIGSGVYLAIFGSILAFAAYLELLKREGPEKVAYIAVLFPVVALVISTFAEDYVWHLPALGGVALVLLGNFVVHSKSFFRPTVRPKNTNPLRT